MSRSPVVVHEQDSKCVGTFTSATRIDKPLPPPQGKEGRIMSQFQRRALNNSIIANFSKHNTFVICIKASNLSKYLISLRLQPFRDTRQNIYHYSLKCEAICKVCSSCSQLSNIKFIVQYITTGPNPQSAFSKNCHHDFPSNQMQCWGRFFLYQGLTFRPDWSAISGISNFSLGFPARVKLLVTPEKKTSGTQGNSHSKNRNNLLRRLCNTNYSYQNPLLSLSQNITPSTYIISVVTRVSRSCL